MSIACRHNPLTPQEAAARIADFERIKAIVANSRPLIRPQLMDAAPRRLPVFRDVHARLVGEPADTLIACHACDYTEASEGCQTIQMLGHSPVIISLREPFCSESWKQSVLRGQALKAVPVTLSKGGHTLRLKALDGHIIADQWMIR